MADPQGIPTNWLKNAYRKPELKTFHPQTAIEKTLTAAGDRDARKAREMAKPHAVSAAHPRRRLVRVQIMKWRVHYHVTMDEEDLPGSKGRIVVANKFLSRVSAEGWIEQVRHDKFPVRTHRLIKSGVANGEADPAKWAYFYREGD